MALPDVVKVTGRAGKYLLYIPRFMLRMALHFAEAKLMFDCLFKKTQLQEPKESPGGLTCLPFASFLLFFRPISLGYTALHIGGIGSKEYLQKLLGCRPFLSF